MNNNSISSRMSFDDDESSSSYAKDERESPQKYRRRSSNHEDGEANAAADYSDLSSAKSSPQQQQQQHDNVDSSPSSSALSSSSPSPSLFLVGTSPSSGLFGLSEFLPLDYSQKTAAVQTQRKLFTATVDTDTLSDDALGLCFFGGFLNTMEVVRLTSVSKRIRRIASQQVTKLDLRKCNRLTPANIASISSNFQNLSDLDFSYCSQFGQEHLEQLLPISQTLKSLSLRGTQVNDQSITNYLSKVSLTYGESNLESIDLSATTKVGSKLVGDLSAQSLSEHCPNLKSINLAWSSLLTDDGISSLSSLSNLSKLDVSLTGITTESSKYFLAMLPLKELNLSATGFDRDGIEHFFSKPCCNLVKFHLRFVEDLTPKCIEVMLRQAPNLNYLDVSNSGHDGKLELQPSLLGTIYQRGVQLKY